MKISSLAKYAVGVTVAAAMLAACSSGGNSSFGPSAAPMGHESGLTPLSVQRVAALTVPHYVARAVHPDHHASFIDPAKKKKAKDLLYVSDWDTSDVYVYDYPKGTSVGTLTGFDYPYASCEDSKGDIYIPSFDNGEVAEYKPGGTSPIKTWTTSGYAIGCSVDSKNDLAVTDFYTSTGAGQLEVYAGGGTKGTAYSDSSACYYMWPFGYDNKGDLVGVGEYSSITECELKAGASSMNSVSFSETIDFPGGSMWDGKYMLIGDQEENGTYESGGYQATLSGSSLSEVGNTVLTDSCDSDYDDTVAPFVVGKKNTPANKAEGTVVVGGNLDCTDRVNFWAYPAGGTPTSSLSGAPGAAYGASVSVGKK